MGSGWVRIPLFPTTNKTVSMEQFCAYLMEAVQAVNSHRWKAMWVAKCRCEGWCSTKSTASRVEVIVVSLRRSLLWERGITGRTCVTQRCRRTVIGMTIQSERWFVVARYATCPRSIAPSRRDLCNRCRLHVLLPRAITWISSWGCRRLTPRKAITARSWWQ